MREKQRDGILTHGLLLDRDLPDEFANQESLSMSVWTIEFVFHSAVYARVVALGVPR
jgi:hypothetical protein